MVNLFQTPTYRMEIVTFRYKGRRSLQIIQHIELFKQKLEKVTQTF